MVTNCLLQTIIWKHWNWRLSVDHRWSNLKRQSTRSWRLFQMIAGSGLSFPRFFAFQPDGIMPLILSHADV